MWTRTPQPGLWFIGGAFSQARIYSRYIALQIDAIEAGRLAKEGLRSVGQARPSVAPCRPKSGSASGGGSRSSPRSARVGIPVIRA